MSWQQARQARDEAFWAATDHLDNDSPEYVQALESHLTEDSRHYRKWWDQNATFWTCMASIGGGIAIYFHLLLTSYVVLGYIAFCLIWLSFTCYHRNCWAGGWDDNNLYRVPFARYVLVRAIGCPMGVVALAALCYWLGKSTYGH